MDKINNSAKAREFVLLNNWDDCMFVTGVDLAKIEIPDSSEKIHVIEKSAYTKVVNVLKDVEKLMSGAPSSAPMTDELILKHVRQTLKELGELTGDGV